MAAGMPELGSKISLISKADIRYEGHLFTVDPQECTIALATVRSFGTEERETQYPVAPQNQIYDYILFRGSDIKDIRVLNNASIANDPAIVQLSVPPSYQPQHQHQHQHQFQLPYQQYHPMAAMPPQLRPQLLATKQPSNMLEMITGGSRADTPMSAGIQRKSPTAEQATQAGHNQHSMKNQKNNVAGQNRQNKQDQQDNKDSRNQQHTDNMKQSNRPRSRNKNINQQDQNQQNQASRQGQNQNQGWGQQRGGGRGGRGGRGRGGFNGRPQGQQGIGARTKNILKFENDYDFEQANTEFDKIRVQLSKVKIDGENPKPEAETEKKDDSGNETGAGEPEHEEESIEAVNCYDKAKSFFDNISCEAVERSKGRSQRRDWRTERKLNSETFGVATARRGGYRGRGYWGAGGGGNGNMQSGWRGQSWRGGNRGGRGGNQQFRQQRQGQNQMQPAPISVPGK